MLYSSGSEPDFEGAHREDCGGTCYPQWLQSLSVLPPQGPHPWHLPYPPPQLEGQLPCLWSISPRSCWAKASRLGRMDLPLWRTPRPPWSYTSWLKSSGSTAGPEPPNRLAAVGTLVMRWGRGNTAPRRDRARAGWIDLPALHLWELALIGRGRLHPRLNIHWSFTSGIVFCIWSSIHGRKKPPRQHPALYCLFLKWC